MVDIVSTEVRSRMMAGIRARNTQPELRLRREMHARGFRFRLHRDDLPGSPDLVFPRFGVAVFVHGCFWHRHEGCRYASIPKTRAEFWRAKFEANVLRDRRVQQALIEKGWRVSVVWECALRKNAEEIANHLVIWMTSAPGRMQIELSGP
jgi:DNA mismatch endonuclease, patch repair protein